MIELGNRVKLSGVTPEIQNGSVVKSLIWE